jgi:hypothetical protein
MVSQELPDIGGKYKAEGLGFGVSFSAQENKIAKNRNKRGEFFMGDKIDFKKEPTLRQK